MEITTAFGAAIIGLESHAYESSESARGELVESTLPPDNKPVLTLQHVDKIDGYDVKHKQLYP